MALINWQWQNPDVINDQRNAVAANKEAMDYNQTAALNSVVDKYMDSTGNMTGDYYTAATKAGLGPDAIAKINAIRADRARKEAEMAEAGYKSWLYGANPHAGDTSTAQSQSNWGNKPLNDALGFNSQENPATGPENYSLLTPDNVYRSQIGMPVYDKTTDTASLEPSNIPSYLKNDNTGFVTPDMIPNEYGVTGAVNVDNGQTPNVGSAEIGFNPAALFGTNNISPLGQEQAPIINPTQNVSEAPANVSPSFIS